MRWWSCLLCVLFERNSVIIIPLRFSVCATNFKSLLIRVCGALGIGSYCCCCSSSSLNDDQLKFQLSRVRYYLLDVILQWEPDSRTRSSDLQWNFLLPVPRRCPYQCIVISSFIFHSAQLMFLWVPPSVLLLGGQYVLYHHVCRTFLVGQCMITISASSSHEYICCVPVRRGAGGGMSSDGKQLLLLLLCGWWSSSCLVLFQSNHFSYFL